ncbi:cell envelope integrity protein CreD [Parabacteroides sp. PF5-9]|uniref:cell envelope integrity protein CreD n=1 Tax=Parabacteroides sp. PF5-9 TaxID=1742404 RepID=UPI0024754010|nr:cell envelope integrity protein CreD [Parabacteroides sp. PF5-9]MDH6356287.1 inner membrane protein [Parabacteroides sp. PF5-9]
METFAKRSEKLSQSITVKALIVAFLTLLLLIPSVMVQELIMERQNRSYETIEKINNKWSQAQTLCLPILSVPYTVSRTNENEKIVYEQHTLHITPEHLDIQTTLSPEEKHYGIYKTILYKSEVKISGQFEQPNFQKVTHNTIHWDKAYIRLGVSDLRGVTNNIRFNLGNQSFPAEAGSSNDGFIGKELIVSITDQKSLPIDGSRDFSCTINLNGSSSIGFIPAGKTTKVHVAGSWNAPGYIGSFSPEHTLDEQGFTADWSILQFNRSIPEMWIDSQVDSFNDAYFGVSLVDTVDHYQQNMRSAKYAIMFIGLTFVIFFFVEILTRRRIHPIQYLLVGLALILFYTLLLSISEQLHFGLAYLIASMATIGLITLYTKSIFNNWKQIGLLTFTLCLLYLFLYVVLQLEDIALLIGSVGLFIILAVIMYCSRKISWYKQEELPVE